MLHIPAFAEEMNCCRHLVSEQSRQLASQGIGVLVLDLFGTGDSSGDLFEASWELWLDNVEGALQWIDEHYSEAKIGFWGVRLGALLALDLLEKRQDLQVHSLLMWQPVLDGDAFMRQFFRIRVAASLFSGKKESVNSLKEQLIADGFIEIAGYKLSLGLVDGISQVTIPTRINHNLEDVGIFEISNSDTPELSLPAQTFCQNHRQDYSGRLVEAVIPETKFWEVHDHSEHPLLIEKSGSFFTSTGDSM